MDRKLTGQEIANIQIEAKNMDEKQRRQFFYRTALELGRGGISFISRTFHVSRMTLGKARKEIMNEDNWEKGSPNRKPGGGRKKAVDTIKNLKETVLKIVDPATYGIPTSTLKWTTMSLRKIADKVYEQLGVKVSHTIIQRILKEEGYSRQKNKKAEQVGEPDPDRNEQFMYIDNKTKEFLESGDPVISVDTKKKENLGNFSNFGTEYRPKKNPRRTLDHDFPIEGLGKVVPYGIYCLNNNTGFVNLGTDHDTSEFAMVSILLWWNHIGKATFPNAKRILITCDCGGSNRSRGQMWKEQLYLFSKLTGLEVHISHFPTGCSKWNKIEHRLFCYISKSWQGQPLIDIETCVSLIGSTTTSTGLTVKCLIDNNKYELNKKVFSKKDFSSLPIQLDQTFGKWNYSINAANIV